MMNVKIPPVLMTRLENTVGLFKQRNNGKTIIVCAAAVSSGLIAVVYAKFFRLCESTFDSLATNHPLLSLVVTPLAFVGAWLIVSKLSPEASGSGIPQVLAANELDYNSKNKSFVDRLLSIRVLVVKIFASIICILGGGAIGREGPTLQVSASLFHYFGKHARRFFPETESHLWIVSGAASGLAAAFNTPLGGIVYAIEELGAHHFDRHRNALLTAIIISGLVSQGIIGDYLYLGSPKIVITGFTALPLAILIGLVSGALGGIWAQFLLYLVRLRLNLGSSLRTGAVVLGCGILMSLLIYANRRASGSGLLFIDDLLFRDQLASPEIVLSRFFGTILTYLSGTAGGIFSPSLAIGAGIGSLFANLMGLPGSHLMVLLGMIGFLTGVTRVPFTSFILVLEMTNQHSTVFPMMTAALCASIGAKIISSQSFYEQIKERYLEGHSHDLQKAMGETENLSA